MKRFFCTALMASVFCATPVLADDISDSIERAQKAYEVDDLNGTRQALGDASQFLNQKTLELLIEVFPKEHKGWKLDKDGNSSRAAGIYGGGNQLNAVYTNAQGQRMSLDITMDSPLVSQMAMIHTNPQLAGTMGKLVYVGSNRALLNPQGELALVLNNRFLIVAGGDSTKEEKIELLQALDMKRLENL